ncbi:MAG: TIGR03862 family flavoprotein [Methylovulum sp.]|nr:TIGR03862 family flavoprotein [Methylovulum sp.]
MLKRVVVIGGGPAGLMAADVLSQAGIRVDIFDAMPTVGRKFLMAGKGGMNITHSEPFTNFLSHYGAQYSYIAPLIKAFTPDALREWIQQLGIATFVGSSGRVFPVDMKAAPLLRAWLHQLRGRGVKFYMRHVWEGWQANDPMVLLFNTPQGRCEINADAIVLALGGGSWGRLGSTGAWVPILLEKNISVHPLKPSNCGFDADWSDYFRIRFAGQPLQTVGLSFTNTEGVNFSQQGELIVTATGMEGVLIYALSAPLREEIAIAGNVVIYLDLAPDRSAQFLIDRLSQSRGKDSLTNYLRKRVGVEGVKAGLLREVATTADFNEPRRLGALLKALPIKLLATRPLDEAISSAGGVDFAELDENLMILSKPGVFCAGEMLDWEAPTGGYLLTACFASGRAAAFGVLAWLQKNRKVGSDNKGPLP